MEQEQSQQENSQQKSRVLFVVSSAIHANWGVYNAEERLNQTIDTLKSIKERVDADIVILDGGSKPLSDEEKEKIQKYIRLFYDFSSADNVVQIQKVNNWDIVKNMIELIIFGSFYDKSKNELSERYDRIFKMSGRYRLNDNFDLNKHLNAEGKIVLHGPYTSQFPSQVTGGQELQYMSRLWSFDARLTPYISETYLKMFNHMNERLNAGGYIDIEHLLCKFLDPRLIELTGKIGIEGNIAPNGVQISD
jgi:hypothetical protein